MSDAALYHTTAATLASARISMGAAWLLAALACMAILIAPFYGAVYAAVFVAVLLLASAYLHLRLHLDALLLRTLASGQLQDAEFEAALLQLRLRKKSLNHSAHSRCIACLADTCTTYSGAPVNCARMIARWVASSSICHGRLVPWK